MGRGREGEEKLKERKVGENPRGGGEERNYAEGGESSLSVTVPLWLTLWGP